MGAILRFWFFLYSQEQTCKHKVFQTTVKSKTIQPIPGLGSAEICKRKIDSNNDTTNTSQQNPALLAYFLQVNKET